VATDFDHPTGLALSTNEKILDVADNPSLANPPAFDVLTAGTLANKPRLCQQQFVRAGWPEGGCETATGGLPGRAASAVFDPTGQKTWCD